MIIPEPESNSKGRRRGAESGSPNPYIFTIVMEPFTVFSSTRFCPLFTLPEMLLPTTPF